MTNLRTARLAKDISQAQLAELAGVDQTTISGLEVGRNKNPSWETVVRLTRALDLNPEDLFPVAPSASDEDVT